MWVRQYDGDDILNKTSPFRGQNRNADHSLSYGQTATQSQCNVPAHRECALKPISQNPDLRAVICKATRQGTPQSSCGTFVRSGLGNLLGSRESFCRVTPVGNMKYGFSRGPAKAILICAD